MADRQTDAVAERFGDNLRRVRRREGLSQEELAVRASLHRTEIGKLENTERVPRIDTLIQLAGAMAIAPGRTARRDLLGPRTETPRDLHVQPGPRARSQRQPSTPVIDEAEEVDEP